MKTLMLKIKKEECKDTCPIPLQLIPNAQKGIKKINYNEKTEKGEITYDERILSKKQIIKRLKEIGYEVRK